MMKIEKNILAKKFLHDHKVEGCTYQTNKKLKIVVETILWKSVFTKDQDSLKSEYTKVR